jgi:hypothetical protein
MRPSRACLPREAGPCSPSLFWRRRRAPDIAPATQPAPPSLPALKPSRRESPDPRESLPIEFVDRFERFSTAFLGHLLEPLGTSNELRDGALIAN